MSAVPTKVSLLHDVPGGVIGQRLLHLSAGPFTEVVWLESSSSLSCHYSSLGNANSYKYAY